MNWTPIDDPPDTEIDQPVILTDGHWFCCGKWFAHIGRFESFNKSGLPIENATHYLIPELP